MGIPRKIIASQTKSYKNLFVTVFHFLIYPLMAIATAILIRTFIGEVYLVPTSSMEGTLLKSDVIWVDKLRYGPKIPLNLSHMPFFGNLFPENSRSKINFFRVRGYDEIERNDIVVFKIGEDSPDQTYVKRCVALPGDLFEIDKNNLIIHGSPQDETELLQFSYRTKDDPSAIARVLSRKIDVCGPLLDRGVNGEISCIFSVAEQRQLEKKGFKLERIYVSNKTPNIFPMSKKGVWNDYQYGPIRIPKKGMQILLNDSTINLYMDLFRGFEKFNVNKDSLGNYYSVNKRVRTYTIKHDYYFMMGDNRHSALDSRHFGFVPKEMIEGNVRRSIFNYKHFNQFFKKIE